MKTFTHRITMASTIIFIVASNTYCKAQQSNPQHKLSPAQPANNKKIIQPQLIPGSSQRRLLNNRSNPEFKCETLVKPVELPDVPEYPSKLQFITGRQFPNVKGGASVTMEFSVNDEPKKVLKWYKNALESNNWSMQNEMHGSTGLAAMKNYNIFQVMAVGTTQPHTKCNLLIRYKFYKPTDFSAQTKQ